MRVRTCLRSERRSSSSWRTASRSCEGGAQLRLEIAILGPQARDQLHRSADSFFQARKGIHFLLG